MAQKKSRIERPAVKQKVQQVLKQQLFEITTWKLLQFDNTQSPFLSLWPLTRDVSLWSSKLQKTEMTFFVKPNCKGQFLISLLYFRSLETCIPGNIK